MIFFNRQQLWSIIMMKQLITF